MINKFFEDLNTSNIRYCHWKSNAHLKKSFEGKTDFDLLIDRNDVSKFYGILLKFRFKRRINTANNLYHSLEDFIGFDDDH